MSLLLSILLGLLAASAFALLVYWSVGIFQISCTMILVPTARRGLALARAATEHPGVCVIVPAHNEARVIDRLVRSLKAQDYPKLSVILSLDRCTDATAALARAAIGSDSRFTVLEIASCPADWAGKVNAVWQAVLHAGKVPDMFLFADADTILTPPCISAMVAMLRSRKLDMISLWSTLENVEWFEYVAQPAAGFELARAFPLIKANRDRDRRPFANGQFMLITRAAYEKTGGHEGLRTEVLEDLALAVRVKQHGMKPGVFLARGIMTCRMYPTFAAFRSGWKRIYVEAANCKVARLRKWSLVNRTVGTALPLASLALLTLALAGTIPEAIRQFQPSLQWLGAAALGVWAIALTWAYWLGGTPLWAFPAHVIGSWIVGGILKEAADDLEAGKPTKWGGREYVRPAR